MSTPNTARIRKLNDQFWKNPHKHGRVVATAGVNAKGPGFVLKCLRALEQYNSWNKDHDPHDEHDMCVLEIDGVTVWAKLDYYDEKMENGSEDPSDPAKTTRVATILFPEEW